jgi:Holliday junction resolvase RusA-like endonuclease
VEYLHNDGWYWFVLDLNPEPWAIGPLSVGRAKGGKMFPSVGRNTQLWHYQQAIKEALGAPDIFFEGKIELRFYFWRRRDEYNTPQARTHRKHEADLTNLQKATEDALQGILFKNDKDVSVIHSWMVQQGPDVEGCVIIAIRAAENNGVSLPLVVMDLQDEIMSPQTDNEWSGPDA